MKYATLTSNFYAYGIGLIVFLVYITRKFYTSQGAKAEIAPGRKIQVYNGRKAQTSLGAKVQIDNSRTVQVTPTKSVQIHHPYEIRRAGGSLRKMKSFVAIGGVFLIWIMRSYLIAPIAGIMSKGLLL